jgi:hypothetical protein
MNLATIEAFGRASGIYDFMNTAWGWPFIESLHYVALAVLLGTVGLFDLRVLGVAKGVAIPALHKLVPFGAFAFIVNVLTGSLFFVTAPDQYLYNPSFQLKVACMLIAGINVAVFYTTLSRSISRLDSQTEPPFSVKVVAAVSLASWIGVIIFGRLITYFRPPYHWCFWC